MSVEPDRIELLGADIDMRLHHLWAELARFKDITGDARLLEAVAAFMRAAYGKGYCDALSEPERGELSRVHGYKIPQRQQAAEPPRRRRR